ncbi:Putative odorant receptor 94b [Trachymyrmex cornetzi]|uniref:Putative odorant receptor 94b n=1 Tax=Trachymyrmex cornetzi TaxID=471704 RepID=A0A195DVS2_9HYME|nr:Putative odorant receptor 94b [Trachymyrmex cornetzi]
MHTLPLSFALLTFTGYWRPINLTSIKYWAYTVYSVAMNFLLHLFTFCGLVDCFISKDLKTFIEKFSLFLSVLGVSCKVTNLAIRRHEIINLTDMLLDDICVPRNVHETDIQRRFDRNAKIITICCEILNESAAFFSIAQFRHFVNTRTLPLYDWVPYDISSTTIFWATLLHQTILIMICANASVAHETLISGFMIQICAQLDILCHRTRILPNLLQEARKCSISKEDFKMQERQLIREIVHHHRYVYRFAERINAVFTLMIFVQFTISSTVLCLCIYQMLTTNLLSVEFAYSSSYLCSMLIQIYLYCWFGNEVTLKSTEIGNAVYEMDWSMLPVDLMKTLLIIITRSVKPIKITSGYIITLSNESFMKLIVMHTLPLSFALLTYTGYWRPINLTFIKYWAYIIYSIVMNFLLYSFTFCGLVDCFITEDLETFIEKFSLYLSVLGVSCKVMNLTLRRDEIIGLTDMLLQDICVPRNDREMDIQRRFDRSAKIITVCCEILNESAVFFATVAQFRYFISTRTLPLSDWVPYDISSTTAFWATMLHQTIGLIICANASVAHETLISGFMIQTCAQLDILCYRARMLPSSLREAQKCSISKEDFKARGQRLIRELVHHHRFVYRFAERINAVFTLMIFVQFTISSTVLCLSIYKMLTKNLLSLEFAWSSSYLGCMLMQIYLYCWFGNEVTLKVGH